MLLKKVFFSFLLLLILILIPPLAVASSAAKGPTDDAKRYSITDVKLKVIQRFESCEYLLLFDR